MRIDRQVRAKLRQKTAAARKAACAVLHRRRRGAARSARSRVDEGNSARRSASVQRCCVRRAAGSCRRRAAAGNTQRARCRAPACLLDRVVVQLLQRHRLDSAHVRAAVGVHEREAAADEVLRVARHRAPRVGAQRRVSQRAHVSQRARAQTVLGQAPRGAVSGPAGRRAANGCCGKRKTGAVVRERARPRRVARVCAPSSRSCPPQGAPPARPASAAPPSARGRAARRTRPSSRGWRPGPPARCDEAAAAAAAHASAALVPARMPKGFLLSAAQRQPGAPSGPGTQ